MSIGGNRPIERLDVGGDVGIGDFLMQTLGEEMRQGLLDVGLPPLSDGIRSPTEIIERVRDLQMTMGAPLGRHVREFLVPLMESVIGDLADAGQLSSPALRQQFRNVRVEPDRIRIDGITIKLVMETQLLRSAQFDAIARVMDGANYIATLGGSAMAQASLNMDELPPWIYQNVGAPPHVYKTASELAQDAKQVAEIAAEAEGASVPNAA